MTKLPSRLRDRRRLVRDRRRQGACTIAGLPFDCFEKSDRVGGNWVFGNDERRCPRRTARCTSTPRASGWSTRTSDAEGPIPTSRITPRSRATSTTTSITSASATRSSFETGVEHAERGDDGVWAITLDNGETRRYDVLLVANGHHWNPRWPEPAFPGQFDGTQMHSHHYVENTRLPRQERARRRDRQQRHGHRGRVELRRPQDVPLLPARRLHPAQVPVRAAARPDRGQRADARPALRVPPRDPDGAVPDRRRATCRTMACPSPTTRSARPIRRSRPTSSTGSPTAR